MANNLLKNEKDTLLDLFSKKNFEKVINLGKKLLIKYDQEIFIYNIIALSQSKLGRTIDAINTLKIAINKKNENFGSKRFVCASDGFFPFNDGVKLLIKNNCEGLAQPKGSINDKKIIEYSNKHFLPLFFIKNRLFNDILHNIGYHILYPIVYTI